MRIEGINSSRQGSGGHAGQTLPEDGAHGADVDEPLQVVPIVFFHGSADSHQHALVIDEIGKDENGTPIEILFGALAMQQWGIRPVPDEERLDLSHYPKEFVEF